MGEEPTQVLIDRVSEESAEEEHPEHYDQGQGHGLLVAIGLEDWAPDMVGQGDAGWVLDVLDIIAQELLGGKHPVTEGEEHQRSISH